MKPYRVQERVRWAAGLAAAGVLVYMSFLSLQEGFSLTFPVIGGMLAVIVVLMYGTSELTRLVEAYQGTSNNGKTQQESNRND